MQQEISLASQYSISLLCGDVRIHWSDVRCAHNVLSLLWRGLDQWRRVRRHSSLEIADQVAVCLYDIVQPMSPTITKIARYERGQLSEHTLAYHLLSNVSQGHMRPLATYGVVYVYGVLNLAKDVELVAEYISLDYGTPIEQLFIDVARYLYNSVGSAALGICGLNANSKLRLPSWASD